MWSKLRNRGNAASGTEQVKEPVIVGYIAVVMTSKRRLVLGKPCGSDGWAATTYVPIYDGESELSKVLAAVDTAWHLNGPPRFSSGQTTSRWRVDGRPTQVSWWFGEIGKAKEFPQVDGFSTIAAHDPYAILEDSLPLANSTVPLIPLSLVRAFTSHHCSACPG